MEWMVFVLLFYEFFKAGLFAVGGGLATLPFLYDIAARYDWLSSAVLPDMIAVSESTPGPIGVNMATYAGFNAAGVAGSLTATVALVTPSVLVIICISKFLARFNEKPVVQSVFASLRPAVAGLIAAAGWQVFRVSIFTLERFALTRDLTSLVSLPALLLFIVIFVLMRKLGGHPILYIAGAAVVGIVLGL